MKTKLLLLLAITFTIGLNAQSITLTSNTQYGGNCSNSQTPTDVYINGDLNLNNNILDLRNTNLVISGNLNGGGSIRYCGNSNICTEGTIEANVTIQNGITFNCTLDVQEFQLQNGIPQNLQYTVRNAKGQILQKGTTNQNTYALLPKNQFIIFKVEKYRVKKLILKRN